MTADCGMIARRDSRIEVRTGEELACFKEGRDKFGSKTRMDLMDWGQSHHE